MDGSAPSGALLGQRDGRLPLNQCRKIFVQRDYTQGLAVRFYTRIPQELQTLGVVRCFYHYYYCLLLLLLLLLLQIDENLFEKTVTQLNQMYEEAEKVGGASACETLLGCATCYLSHLCITHQYDKKLQRIAKYLREQNESVYLPRGLFITDPIERGLRVLEISCLTEPVVVRPPNMQ